MNDFIKKEKKYIFFGEEFACLKDASLFFDVSMAMMSLVFNGKKSPSKAMLEKCGYSKITTTTTEYQKIPTLPKGED